MVAMDGVCMEGCKDWKLLGIPTGENYVNQVNRKSHFAHIKVIFNQKLPCCFRKASIRLLRIES